MKQYSRRQVIKSAAAGSLAALTQRGAHGAEKTSIVSTPAHEEDANIRPSKEQLAWQKSELSMFFHFGMNTFTDREWGTGNEDPALFNPTDFDPSQWIGTAKAAGFKYAILTAKHHDGFCLWPSAYTDHCVKSSPWKGGKGDVVGEFASACHAAGLKLGLYLSPWDRHEARYGDSPAYNRYYMNQLTELMTRYGDIAEVWFDGANGEGPNGRRQEYDWQGFYQVIRKHQPRALIAISGPDIRWVGNEDGFGAVTEWSVQPPNPIYHAGIRHDVWWPAECDVSIRPGWFWHESQDTEVKSLTALMDIYYRSVGRNCVLLLNVPPNKTGRLSDPDVMRLHQVRKTIDAAFAHDLAVSSTVTASRALRNAPAASVVDGRSETYWSPGSFAREGSTSSIDILLGTVRTVDVICLQEHIADGQRVAKYEVEGREAGAWKVLVTGTTIGHKKLDRIEPVSVDAIRLTLLECNGAPEISGISIYNSAL